MTDRRALYLDLEAACFPGATPAEVAAELDVSGQTVRNWRAGSSPPSLPILWVLAARRVTQDPRPFPEVLTSWLERRGLSYYAAAKLLDVSLQSPANWAQGKPVGNERALRALMGQIDANAIR